MTAVTTDGARNGAEHSDHTGCSFPFFLVAATRPLATTKVWSGADAARHDDVAATATTDTGPATTTRVTAA
ncbi:hypothetical protein [Haloarchaeobius litoreus]|uniref:Uncharacterized protein n=1 Tax=Haloarchaeobius litoreus TaxID=755306 RepID=A0ABD6DH78_9EURY|nr:hypothetical protein [Haloarchaeobius litoreus]